ncbi:hypothetical protein EXIGLDRAFT_761270 [Exidia glandulosa HHB12029]|uniref:Uncharacterized protein n=1 Tax=Exidia glandulosa HHB12029 TaxID=1314781 RepID=A0A165NND5_EXIGL|nr:hypothetical protein EXIGLDRAFT_761270 [Exidia glandulosa HHB12029]
MSETLTRCGGVNCWFFLDGLVCASIDRAESKDVGKRIIARRILEIAAGIA